MGFRSARTRVRDEPLASCSGREGGEQINGGKKSGAHEISSAQLDEAPGTDLHQCRSKRNQIAKNLPKLSLFETTQKFPARSCCGNEKAQIRAAEYEADAFTDKLRH